MQCISEQSVSPTMKLCLITLIPKPNRDKSILDNWCPITLLCDDYKIWPMFMLID